MYQTKRTAKLQVKCSGYCRSFLSKNVNTYRAFPKPPIRVFSWNVDLQWPPCDAAFEVV